VRFGKKDKCNLSELLLKTYLLILTHSGRIPNVIRREGKVGRENLRFAVNVPFMCLPGIDPNIHGQFDVARRTTELTRSG
jgi:hypothetical protein